MQEIWKDIRGYEGRYQVSSAGKVKSLDTTTLTINKQKRFYKGKIITPSIGSAGYFVVNLRSNAKTKQFKVHRLVIEAFIGYSELFVNHKDLNKLNNSIENLEYVTNAENLLHAFKNGVKVGKTILNADQREKIRLMRKSGFLLKTIAKKFNVSESAISEVARGTTWNWEKK